MPYYRFLLIVLVILLFTACTPAPVTPTDTPPTPPLAAETSTAPNEASPTDATVPTNTVVPAASFPAEAQRIEFKSEDETPLVGYYYPASVNPAPVIVLMHWVGGSNCEWVHVNLVQWLQNRSLTEGVAANPACQPVQLPFTLALNEYPPMPAGRSFAVFAIDYRGHGESGGTMREDGWLQDSTAAVQMARTLPGADPEQVATIGASIGADGAVDGCGAGCLGGLSFSPGNYLGLPYSQVVETLGKEKKPSWCITSQGDRESFPACEAASGEFYKKIVYDENEHGMSFFKPGFEPETGQNILDFLLEVFEN